MTKTEEPLTQLATRIPKELHRRLKLHCVTHDTALMHFVTEAIEEKFERKTRLKKGLVSRKGFTVAAGGRSTTASMREM